MLRRVASVRAFHAFSPHVYCTPVFCELAAVAVPQIAVRSVVPRRWSLAAAFSTHSLEPLDPLKHQLQIASSGEL